MDSIKTKTQYDSDKKTFEQGRNTPHKKTEELFYPNIYMDAFGGNSSVNQQKADSLQFHSELLDAIQQQQNNENFEDNFDHSAE